MEMHSKTGSVRQLQCTLLLLCRVLQQSMRLALGPLLIFMKEEQSYSTQDEGRLLSAVALGYLCTQVPGGALADRIGAKLTITVVLALSSVCCLLVPITGAAGVWPFYYTLALMGAVHGSVSSLCVCLLSLTCIWPIVAGPLFPTSSVFLSSWMPPDERGWASTQLDTGITVGTLLITPIAGFLGQEIGWRNGQ